ncbi:MAG: pirin family protein [Schleiferiaceae bacterium]|nr:pirin family protein [Schleiferiaceae bacterium]
MSNIDFIIEERAADIGNFLVGRLLPFRQKRTVGPFVFIDHMGPEEMGPDQNLEVGPHPHIGLSTLTYLFEGAILHRDSLGTSHEITPGAVNWMTAGKGVVHSERTPNHHRGKQKTLHGFQIWVALPKELEDCEPSFYHITAEELPTWKEADIAFKLIAGSAFGKTAPVPVHSDLYFIELRSEAATTATIGDGIYGESALYILQGEVKANGQTFGPKQLLVTKEAAMCHFEMGPNTIVYLFGGTPFPEERYIDWNFVATSKETLKKAKHDWENKNFPAVPGDNDYVPYPKPFGKNA